MNLRDPVNNRRCRWVRERLPAYSAGDLPPSQRQRMEEHLAACQACRRELARMEEALAVLRAAGTVEPPDGAIERTIFAINAEPTPQAIARRRRLLRLTTAGAAATLVGGLLVAAVMVLQSVSGPAPIGAGPPAGPGGRQAVGHMMLQPPERPSAEAGTSAGVGRWEHRETRTGAPEASPAVEAERPKPMGVSPRPRRHGPPKHRPSAPRPKAAEISKRAEVGGQLSSRPVAIKPGATRPGPAREAVPHTRPTLPQAPARRALPGGLPAGASAADRASPRPMARSRPAGAAKAVEPGEPSLPPRAMALSAKALPSGAGKWAVSDEFWQIRVEVPDRLVRGARSHIAVTVAGRSSLGGLQVRVRGDRGGWLGDAVEVPLVPQGGTVDLAVPVEPPAAGKLQAAVVVRAEVPELLTEIPVTLRVVEPPPRRSQEVSALLREVPLRQAAEVLARQAGVEVEVPDAVASVAVDADLSTPVPIEAALRVLAEQVGARVEKTDKGFRLVLEVDDGAPGDE